MACVWSLDRTRRWRRADLQRACLVMLDAEKKQGGPGHQMIHRIMSLLRLPDGWRCDRCACDVLKPYMKILVDSITLCHTCYNKEREAQGEMPVTQRTFQRRSKQQEEARIRQSQTS